MNHRRTSFAFLMEMLWVCGFFILSACIFVLAFVKADQLSRHAGSLNQAVVAVENAVESTFSLYCAPLPDGTEEQTELYFDNRWTPEAGLLPGAALEPVPTSGSGAAPEPVLTSGSGTALEPVQTSGSGAAPHPAATAYRIVLHTSWQDGLLTIRASAFDDTRSSGDPARAEELYSLEASRYYPLQPGERSAE